MKLNPYIAGNPVGGGDAFIGRADVLREVLRVLRNPNQNALVLYGQRRIGKTSVLDELKARLPDSGPYHPVCFNLENKATWSLDQVLSELAQTIARDLSQPPPNLGADPETAFRAEWLPLTLANLPDQAQLVLLFDEFDVLADPQAGQSAAAFFPYLRDLLVNDPHRLDFVFVVGRNVDDLDNIALSLFKGIPSYRVSLLNLDDTLKLVRLSDANATLHWHDEAAERVYQLTNGHPFLTQQLCYLVWEQAYETEPTEPPVVATADIEAVIPDTLNSVRNALVWLWGGLPPAERVVASALAEAGPDPITQAALVNLLHESGVRVIIRDLQNAPQLLRDWDLIEPVDDGYRFRVELLRRWVAQNRPLHKVQEELSVPGTIDNNFYQAALGLYRNGQSTQAVNPLRQALDHNPYHIQANELLAEILLNQGQIAEARQLMENFYEYQPGRARPYLVRAILHEAQTATSDDEQLILYERVLELEKNQPEAAAGKQQIWIGRGDDDLAHNNLDKALRAYQQANLPEYVAKVEALLRRRRLEESQREMGLLERAGKYAAALGIAKQLHQDYPDERDSLPDLELLERKTKLDDLYQQAVGALQANDRTIAQKLLAEVVSLEPTYQEATRYLHKAVTGLDVEELQLEVEIEQETWQQKEAKAQAEISVRQEEIKLLQDQLNTEKETRQQEIELRRQFEIETARLQGQLKAETEARKKTEVAAQEESKRIFQFEVELKQLQDQLKTELESRQKVEKIAQQEALLNEQQKIELNKLRLDSTAERKWRQDAEAELTRLQAQRHAPMNQIVGQRQKNEAKLKQPKTQSPGIQQTEPVTHSQKILELILGPIFIILLLILALVLMNSR